MRLPSRLRLKQSGDFARLRTEGRTFGGRALVVSARRIEGLCEFGFGLITSKKVGIAVVRNQTRRRLREIIRKHLTEIAPGFHWVVIARWKAPQLTQEELEKDWLHLAKRAGILRRPDASQPAPLSSEA